jgi:hypothetical protein
VHFLTNVERADDKGRFRQTVYCDSIPLAWAVREMEGSFKAEDLARGVSHFVDLASFRDHSPKFRVHVSAMPLRYESLFGPGIFRFTVRVAGDGVKAAEIKVRIEWTGSRSTLVAAVSH